MKHPPSWNRIAPGVYDDGEGGMHLDLGELLTAHGYQDTPANRDLMTTVATTLLRRDGIPVTVVED